MLRRPCPDPRCHDGTIATSLLSAPPAGRGRAIRASWRICHTCRGAGTVEEGESDLRSAGVVLWDSTDEDFRSLPLHCFD